MRKLKFALDELYTAYSRPGSVVIVKLPKRMSAKSALEASVQKWEFLVQTLEQNISKDTILDGSVASCGLCQKYLNDGANCYNCPVVKAGGKPYCGNTPYKYFADATDKIKHMSMGNPNLSAALRAQKEWAKKELEFLKSLKP